MAGGFSTYGQIDIRKSIEKYSMEKNTWEIYRIQWSLNINPIVVPVNDSSFIIFGGGDGKFCVN